MNRRIPQLFVLLVLVCQLRATPRNLRGVLDSKKAFVGASIDWSSYDLQMPSSLVPALRARLGYLPKVVTMFLSLPLSPGDLSDLSQIVPPLAAKNTVIILTVEPHEGLDAVTDDAIDELVRVIVRYEQEEQASFVVRFGHEMNGDWYRWGQQPSAFKATFRRVADKVHAWTSEARVMFCPAIDARGYPFSSRLADLSDIDRQAMDTNGNGQVDNEDDPYGPFWPGDEFVDLIGGSVYFWGVSWPWGENHVPPPTFFHDALTERDFYYQYSERKGIPMIVVETAALYNTCDGANTPKCVANAESGWLTESRELAIKQAWWEQVFSQETADRFPYIKAVNLFVVSKPEQEVAGSTVEWGFGDKDSLKRAFRGHMRKISVRSWFVLKV